MIGLDFPLKPEWIHAVLCLWKPNQPIVELIDSSLSQAMPELSGEKTRRNSLSILLRMFVPMQSGNSRSRSTTQQNVWAVYASLFSPNTLAPAFLARIIAESEVAQAISRYINKRYSSGSTITSSEIRVFAAGKFGERKVVVNAASAFLTTLQAFGILTPGEGRSEHNIHTALAVSPQIFPLLVWSWWQQNPMPQIDPETFLDLPAYQWLVREDFSSYWQSLQPDLWNISARMQSQLVTLKFVDPLEFEKRIIEIAQEKR